MKTFMRLPFPNWLIIMANIKEGENLYRACRRMKIPYQTYMFHTLEEAGFIELDNTPQAECRIKITDKGKAIHENAWQIYVKVAK